MEADGELLLQWCLVESDAAADYHGNVTWHSVSVRSEEADSFLPGSSVLWEM